jgi:hypothetical protein
MSLFKKHGNRHLICLHHFLTSLKDQRCAVDVRNLAKARTEREFAGRCQEFVEPLQRVLDTHNYSAEIIAALRKEFGKAGLTFDGNVIAVGRSPQDHERWNSVFMMLSDPCLQRSNASKA